MRLGSVLGIALSAAVLLSCSKESAPRKGAGLTEITATLSDSGTKTVLGPDNSSVLWSPNDEISVFYNEDGLRFTSLNTSPSPTATFTALKGFIFAASEGSSSGMLYGIYPYSESNAQEGDTLFVNVPSSQESAEGSFGRGCFPSVGRSRTTEMAFYNVCGGLRFSVGEDGIHRIRFSGNDGENLAGTAKVRFPDSGVPEVAGVKSGETSVTVSAPGGGTFIPGKHYFISLLPASLSNGFNLEFQKRADFSERGSRSFTKPVSVKRSVFGTLDNADSGVSYKVGIAALPVTPSTVIISPGSSFPLSYEVSPSDAEYEWTKWASSNPEVATVDNTGRVSTLSSGESAVYVSSDNGTVGTCMVYVSSNPVETLGATTVESTYATLNGSGDLAGFASLKKSVYFLYSSSETTFEGLKSRGIRSQAEVSGKSFSTEINSLALSTTYYYIAVTEAAGTTYYGAIKSFTTGNMPASAVNLGLSVYWSNTNVGAASPEDCGGYFGWGETASKSDYTWKTYSLCNSSYAKLTKYVNMSNYGSVDNKKVLELTDDTARSVLGGGWRMPTMAEWNELREKCVWKWTSLNGTFGYEVSSSETGKSIFLPAVGMRVGSELDEVAKRGYYWSSEIAPGFLLLAHGVCFDQNNIFEFFGRCFGRSVRPVIENQ